MSNNSLPKEKLMGMSIEDMKKVINLNEDIVRIEKTIQCLWDWKGGVNNGKIERIHVMGGAGFLATDLLTQEDYIRILKGVERVFQERKEKIQDEISKM